MAVKAREWVACSEREFGHVGATRHLIHYGHLTTLCGATAMPANIWRRNSVKPECRECVRLDTSAKV